MSINFLTYRFNFFNIDLRLNPEGYLGMRISDLVRETGIPRETIHYYSREGLLPKPKKSSRNQAEYGEDHIERLFLIKELQDRFFLPLSAIKKIIQEQKKSKTPKSLIHIKTEYFNPLDQFLPEEIHGEEAFLKAIGLSPDRLADFEDWKIINPEIREGEKVYSHDDIKIGQTIGDLRRLGISYEKGFRREGLKIVRDMLQEISTAMARMYWKDVLKSKTLEEAREMTGPAEEVGAIFIYHLYKRLVRADYSKESPVSSDVENSDDE